MSDIDYGIGNTRSSLGNQRNVGRFTNENNIILVAGIALLAGVVCVGVAIVAFLLLRNSKHKRSVTPIPGVTDVERADRISNRRLESADENNVGMYTPSVQTREMESD